MKRLSTTVTGWTALLCIASYVQTASAETLLRSNVERVSVLELYTSEGCNSCPPADQWLSTLIEHPALWNRVIPLAFHVDYWNNLGWEDRFSQSAFSRRQHRYTMSGGLRFVYTPGFVLDGKEWHGYRHGQFPAGDRDKTGTLSVKVRESDVVVTFQPSSAAVESQLSANIALLGFGLTSEIRAGENKGRHLRHDFVVLDFVQQSLTDKSSIYSTAMPRPKTDVDADRYGIAVWVTASNRQAPLQAVGGWLDIDNSVALETDKTKAR